MKKTTDELTKQLQAAGFIHITGLPIMYVGSPADFVEKRQNYRVQADEKDLGCTGCNNGMMVLITEDGEVWLSSSGNDSRKRALESDLGAKFRERNAGVPCSNGETIHVYWLTRRATNPYDNCDGAYPADPHPMSEKDWEAFA